MRWSRRVRKKNIQINAGRTAEHQRNTYKRIYLPILVNNGELYGTKKCYESSKYRIVKAANNKKTNGLNVLKRVNESVWVWFFRPSH